MYFLFWWKCWPFLVAKMIWLCVRALLPVYTQSEFSVVNLTALSTPCERAGKFGNFNSAPFSRDSMNSFLEKKLCKCRFTNPILWEVKQSWSICGLQLIFYNLSLPLLHDLNAYFIGGKVCRGKNRPVFGIYRIRFSSYASPQVSCLVKN